MAHLTRREFLQGTLIGGAALAGAGFLTPLLSGCSSRWKTRERAKFRRTILLGFDGFDPRLVRDFMTQGLMPNFTALAAAGGFMSLAAALPPMSPIAWSSMSTGCNPGEHGIFDFTHRDPGQYLLYISMRKSVEGLRGTQYVNPRAREGFWRFTSDVGAPTTVVRYPITFPAEKVNGRMLAGLGVPDLVGNEGTQLFFVSPDPEMKTEIEGPATGEKSSANLPLSARVTSSQTAEVRLPDMAPFTVRLLEWSDWVPLKFKVGLRTLHGITKFLLTETSPGLKLYMTPVNIDPLNQTFPITYPESYAREIVEKNGLFYTLGLPEAMHPVREGWYGYGEFLKQVAEIDRERLAMLDLELGRFQEGLLAFVFDACDRVQHAFWFTRDPKHPAYTPEKAAPYLSVIPELYGKMDAALGKVWKHVDDQTALIVCSDHGFETYRRSFHVNRWLVQSGYASLVAETDQGGKGLLRDMDWSKTRAYAIGFTSIYLNLAGRESQGIVRPGTEADRIATEIAVRLKNLTDPDTGERVCNNVYRSDQVYHGAKVKEAPDLIMGLNPGWRTSFQTALGGVPPRLFDNNTGAWTGDHLFDPLLVPGILLSNRPIKATAPLSYDIAATILDCLSIERPDYMEGRSFL